MTSSLDLLRQAGDRARERWANREAASRRMTRDLVTPYEKGQEVVLIVDLCKAGHFTDPDETRTFRPGAVGVIRWIVISDANDGDDTVPLFCVRVGKHTLQFSADEIASVAEAEVHLWLQRQLDALDR
jgi:hypothetical protein